jgi:NAD-dependent SIR2 family protein deacetylase
VTETSTTTTGTLDGNAAAGAFAEVFGLDISLAELTCIECGTQATFAEQQAYPHGPGVTLRCHACNTALARVAITPRGLWMSMTGTKSWHLPRTQGAGQ